MRTEKQIVIRENEKDLTFVVKQMPATKGFRFGLKCAKAFAKTQAEAVDKKTDGTVLNVWLNSIASLDIEAVDEIMEEALSCVTFASPVGVRVCTSDVLDEIIEDPANVFVLLRASLEENLSFIVRHIPEDFLKNLRGEIAEVGQTLQTSKKAQK